MLRVLGWGLYIAAVLFLTVLTEVGGAILVFSTLVVWSYFPIGRLGTMRSVLVNAIAFIVIYLAVCILLVPQVAPLYGRVELPCYAKEGQAYAALTPLTCLFNRHYAVPEAHEALAVMAEDVNRAQPGTVISYLDAGFPFFDGFPLLPHLSHRNGRDIDLAYFYLSAAGRYLPGEARSPIGYFGFEQPRAGAGRPCAAEKGFRTLRWDLDWLQWLLPAYRLDEARTAEMLSWLVLEGPRHGVTGLIIEPHMSDRLGVHSQLIRFQGCKAARHDDHVHVDF